jgi:tRNA-guanine family transglycosylase
VSGARAGQSGYRDLEYCVGTANASFRSFGEQDLRPPIVWLGQSVRTTVVTRSYPSFANHCWMVSLGDAVHRPRLIERVFCGDLKQHLRIDGPVMLDSGGFTMMMQNRGLRVSEIARIYKMAKADFCISLDVPLHWTDSKKTRKRKHEKTRANLEYLLEHVSVDKLVPVVHGFEAAEVDSNCKHLAAAIPEPTIVCIGGLVPLLRRSGRESEASTLSLIGSLISLVRSRFPRSLVHVLGAGSPQTISSVIRLGADSTDSIAWRRAAGFGTIFLPGRGERFLQARDRLRATSRPTINALELRMLMDCRCPACSGSKRSRLRVAELAKSYIARAAHNAFVITGEAKAAWHAAHSSEMPMHALT